MRRAARCSCLALLLGWSVAGVATAGPAAAHAVLVSTDPGEGARLETAPARGDARVQRGGLPRRRVRPGARLRRRAGRHGDGVGRRRRPHHPAPGRTSPTTATWSPTASSRPTRTRSRGRSPSSSATASSSRPAPRREDATDPVVAAAPAGRPLARLRRPRARGRRARPGARSAGRAAGRRPGCAGWPAGERWRSPWPSVLSFLLQGPYAAGDRPRVGARPVPAGGHRRLRGRAGRCSRAAVLALALAAVLLPVWRRGSPAVGGPHRRRRRARGRAGGQHGRDRPSRRRTVAGPRGRRRRRPRRRHGRLAGRPGGDCCSSVLRPPVPAADLAVVAHPAGRASRSARWRRWWSAAPCRRSARWARRRPCSSTTYGWVLVAKLVLVAVLLGAAGVSRVWVHQRLGIRRPRPAGRRRVTAHAFAGAGRGRAAAADDGPAAVRDRSPVRGRRRARARPAPLGAGGGRGRGRGAGALGGARRHPAGPRRRSTGRSTCCCRSRAAPGPSGSVQVSVDPARRGGQHAARLPLRRLRPAHPAGRRSR